MGEDTDDFGGFGYGLVLGVGFGHGVTKGLL